MDKSVQKSVPKSLFIFIIIILAAMYYYAAFVDKSAPEKTVQNFYQAYFTRDFETVANNLSVFWAVQLLPEYSSSSPAQLIEKRPEIEKDMQKFISTAEAGHKMPEKLSIEIMKDYTKLGKNSAIVVYTFKDNGKDAGMEAAILIKEQDRLRIFNFIPVNQLNLEQLKKIDINILDENFAQLTGSKK